MKSTCRLFGVLFSAVCLSLLVIPVKLAIADAQSKRIGIEYELPKESGASAALRNAKRASSARKIARNLQSISVAD